MSRIVIFLSLLLLGSAAHAADVRLALVIGNSKYTEFGTLENPVKDAKGMSQALKEMGYTTKLILDADESTMRREVKRFAAASQGADVALVYYAGHGSQVGGENYLLPVDLELPKVDTDIQLSSIKVDDVINSLKSKVKIFLLDACRDNPVLAKNLVKGRGTYRGGLAPVNSTIDVSSNEGVFIAYSTDSGNIASDGFGNQNSPFTAALLKNIKAPVSIDDMFSMVTREVKQQTGNKQRPYKYASLEGIFCIPMNCQIIANKFNSTNSDVMVIDSSDGVSNKFAEEDAWIYVNDDNESAFFYSPKSLETLDNKRKINFLSYRFVDSKKPKDPFFLDAYSKSEVVLDCVNNKSYISQVEIYDNKFNLVDANFFGNWRSLEPSVDISAGSIMSLIKKLACNGIRPPVINTSELEKFWASGADVNNGVKMVKSVLTYLYDKSSIKKINSKIQVSIKIIFSIPNINVTLDNKYRELVGLLNKYKINYMQRELVINCKENIVEAGFSFNYSDKLSTPITYFELDSVEILPSGNFDYLRGLLCKN